MNISRKGLVVAVVHVLLVCSLGAKLMIDRKTRPRVWVQTESFDPEHLIRGRYVSLRLRVTFDGHFSLTDEERVDREEMLKKYPAIRQQDVTRRARLEVKGGKLVAVPDDLGAWIRIDPAHPEWAVWPDPVNYYIPEHVEDPSRQPRGTSVWAEVTIPKKGPPRPIQLATSGPQGWHVLNLR